MNTARGRGRPAASSKAIIERAAIELFLEHGYAETTIPMIAEASGVSRTSVFRYWGSKAEIIWGEFDRHTSNLAEGLRVSDQGQPTMAVVRAEVVANLGRSIEDSQLWMERFAVLDSSRELRSEESAHWIDWAHTVAAFVAERHGLSADGVVAQSIGGAVQAGFLAVLREWRRAGSEWPERPTSALLAELDEALTPLGEVLQEWLNQVR
ncbi:mycofactocin system transcriptional regulator [Leifsonia kafniensis]|uniref:Mycofactocin system transcriptional regulator n=1 Tax=Leifsonia kafniensis TaxID=475957 RepID=A0ABP7K2C0_9MICO